MKNRIKKELEEKGYIRIRNVLNFQKDIKPVLNDLEAKADKLIEKYFTTKEAKRLFKLKFQDKYFALTKKSGVTFEKVFNNRPPQNLKKHENIEYFNPESIFNLIKSDKILNIVEKIIGKEIFSNPVQTFRVKKPNINSGKNFMDGLIGRTPWHQDEGTINKKARFKTDLVTVWIPFTKTNAKNGCMLAVPKSNKLGLLNHHHGSKGQVEIKNSELIHKYSKMVPLEADVGDIIILDKRLIHCSLPNVSKNIRISMDIRFHKAGQSSGREPLPSFYVRSAKEENIKVKTYQQWVALWNKAYMKSLNKGYTFKYYLPIYNHSKQDYSKKLN